MKNNLSKLKANPRNPRLPWAAEQAEDFKKSLLEFGDLSGIVLNTRTGQLVGGHKRVEAFQAAKNTRIECGKRTAPDAQGTVAHGYVIVDGTRWAYREVDWPAKKEAAANLAANQWGAEWDWEGVGGMLKAIDGEFDTEMLGFDLAELERDLPSPEGDADAEPQIDKAKELQKKWGTKLGQLWRIGEHRLLCGDSTKREDVERVVGDAKPVLMVTDPPYGIELDSEWRDRAGLNICGPAQKSYMKHRTEGHVRTVISGDTRADWSDAFALLPCLQVAYVWHASKFTREVLDGLLRIGFDHHQQIIWDKGRTVLTRTHYWFQHEPCWYVRKKNAPWYGVAGDNSTIWSSPSPKFIMGGSDEPKIDHPTQKPVSLMRKPIENHLLRGEWVYEPFMGSGTTLVAAHQLERRCCGIEIDPDYVAVILQRMQDAFPGIDIARLPAGARVGPNGASSRPGSSRPTTRRTRTPKQPHVAPQNAAINAHQAESAQA